MENCDEQDNGQVLTVGSVPLDNSEKVLRTCGQTIGTYVAALQVTELLDLQAELAATL